MTEQQKHELLKAATAVLKAENSKNGLDEKAAAQKRFKELLGHVRQV